MFHPVKNIPADQRLTIERLLGRPLLDDESLIKDVPEEEIDAVVDQAVERVRHKPE